MVNFDVDFKGMDELLSKFEKMEAGLAAKRLETSSRKAMLPMQEEVKQHIRNNASVETGLLHKSIIVVTKTYPASNSIVTKVGVDKNTRGMDSKGHRRIPSKYAGCVEAKKPFMKPAFDAEGANIVRNFGDEMEKVIDKLTR